MRISRRALLLGAVGVAACEGSASNTTRGSSTGAAGVPAITPAAPAAGRSVHDMLHPALSTLPAPPPRDWDPSDDFLSVDRTRHDGGNASSIYDQVINEILLHRERLDDVICQMLLRPDRGCESAIFLQRRDASWQLVARRSVVRLGDGVGFRLAKGMDCSRILTAMAGSIEESARPLSQALVGTLQRVWTEMLLRTRARTGPELGFHADHYSFAHHHLAGVTMVRRERSLAARLVKVGRMLLEATTLRGAQLDAAMADVEARATALLTDLSQLYDLGPRDWDPALEKLYGGRERP